MRARKVANNAQKTPLVDSLNRLIDEKTQSFNNLLGKALPASVISVDPSGTIVTIKFEIESDIFTFPQVTCAVAQFPFIRYPIVAGGDNPTKGFTVPAAVYLGGVTGLGGGTADLTPQANLSSLVFVPTGNKSNTPTDDPQALVEYGPNGVILRDENSNCIFKLTPLGISITLNGVPLMTFSSDGIALTFAGKTIAISDGALTINGNNLTMIDGHNFLLHGHTDVQPGGGNSGPVTP